MCRHRKLRACRLPLLRSRSILAERDIFVKRAALRHHHGWVLHEQLCFAWCGWPCGIGSTIVGTVLSALAVAVLWGGNIGAVYPFMKVVFEGKSLQQWVDGESSRARQTAAELTGRLETLDKELAAAGPQRRPKLESDMATTQSRLAAERRAERTYVWLKPYLDRYLPERSVPDRRRGRGWPCSWERC